MIGCNLSDQENHRTNHVLRCELAVKGWPQTKKSARQVDVNL